MNSVQHDCEVRRLIQQGFEVFDRLFLGKIQSKLLLDLFVHIAVFDVRNVGIHHQGNQVKNEICTLAENRESREAEIFEPGIMGGLRTTHAIHHFLANLDRGREWLRVTS